MATYVLDGKASAALRNRPLTVTMSMSGAGARLVARTRSGADAPGAIVHSAAMLILPRVAEEVTVVAVPDGGRTQFDDGTVLHVTIGPDNALDQGADIAQLTPRDVSGLGFIELATIAPGGVDTLTVTTRLAVPDAPLPALAAQARVASRTVLRVDQVHESRRQKVRCVVDTSTSMAAAFGRGAVGAAGDIVAGVAAVVSGEPQVDVVFAGPVPDRGVVDGAKLGDALARPPAAGFGIAPDLYAALALPSDCTFSILITDESGAAGLSEPPGVGTVSTIVLTEVNPAPRRTDVAGATLRVPAGTDPRGALAGDTQEIRTAVAAVLAPLTLQSSSL